MRISRSRNRCPRGLAIVGALLAGAAFMVGQAATPALAATSTTAITVDGTSAGLTFDGIGAISGGGGNTRLLADYPSAQRGQILDYLFTPGYGADLQILKVEIGGDTNSTDGAEASIEHTKGTVNCDAGYEWWLMEQAKARNPDIEFYGLAWGAPGWVRTFDSTATINYLISWLGCAARHGLRISYLGGEQNERDYDARWIERLRTALDAAGYSSVRIVGGDNFGWSIASSMSTDRALDDAVGVVGSHYPCGYLSAMTSCSATSTAKSLDKPLWASENGSEDAETGAEAVARAINRGYIGGDLTAYINWPLVASLYQNLDFSDDGLMTANQPWSGAYSVSPTLWAIAQTTQFTEPGWHYLDSSTGYLGGSSSNGSYVSYAAAGGSAWSTVFETTTASAARTVTLSVVGGLPAGTLNVWSTDLGLTGTTTPRMVRDADLVPVNGRYTLTLRPGEVYTVTTTTGQGAGTATGRERSVLPLPYTDRFSEYSAGEEAQYFATMNGAFEAQPCEGGVSGECLRQMAETTPVRWTQESSDQPYTVMGDLSWSNYTVSSKVLFERSDSDAEILGRVGQQARNNNGLDAYHLRLSDSGGWELLKSDDSRDWTTLARGTVTAPGTGTWNTLSLGFRGSTITAAINEARVATVTDTSYSGGMAGLGTAGYYPVEYSDFSVTPGTTTSLNGTYYIESVNSGDVLDADKAGTAEGTPIIQWPVNGGANQRWRLTENAGGYYTITGVGSGRPLAIPHNTTWPGTRLRLRDASGGANQQWLVRPVGDGTYAIESRSDGDLMDVASASTNEGAAIDQWYDNGGANQEWELTPVG